MDCPSEPKNWYLQDNFVNSMPDALARNKEAFSTIRGAPVAGIGNNMPTFKNPRPTVTLGNLATGTPFNVTMPGNRATITADVAASAVSQTLMTNNDNNAKLIKAVLPTAIKVAEVDYVMTGYGLEQRLPSSLRSALVMGMAYATGCASQHLGNSFIPILQAAHMYGIPQVYMCDSQNHEPLCSWDAPPTPKMCITLWTDKATLHQLVTAENSFNTGTYMGL